MPVDNLGSHRGGGVASIILKFVEPTLTYKKEELVNFIGKKETVLDLV